MFVAALTAVLHLSTHAYGAFRGETNVNGDIRLARLRIIEVSLTGSASAYARTRARARAEQE